MSVKSRVSAAAFEVRRAAVRSFRIALGATLALVPLWAGSWLLDILTRPLGSLTLLNIATLVFGSGFVLVCAFGTWLMAFGPPPDEVVARRASNSEAKLARERVRAEAEALRQERIEASGRRLGRWVSGKVGSNKPR